MFQEGIFRPYDIRGEYPKEFDEDFAQLLGSVFCSYIGRGIVVVGRDSRGSSSTLSAKVIDGIVTQGGEVVDIGMVSTPLFYFSVIEKKADGGVMVTASHLGEEFAGFKLVRKGAVAVGGEAFYKETKAAFTHPQAVGGRRGRVESSDVLAAYCRRVVELSGLSVGDIRARVEIKGNEIAQREARMVLEALAIPVVDGEEADVGFQFDPDMDRIAVLGKGGKMRGDVVGGVLAAHFYAGKTVVFDPRYSRGVVEYMKRHGIHTVLSRVGHTFIKETMSKYGAEFCAEGSGHMYFKEMGYVESPHLAMLKFLALMQDTGKGPDELAHLADFWARTDEISFTIDSFEEALRAIDKAKAAYSDAHISTIDGVKIEYSDWGFLLRPSNTEPKLRLIVEAKTAPLLEKRKKEVVALLK